MLNKIEINCEIMIKKYFFSQVLQLIIEVKCLLVFTLIRINPCVGICFRNPLYIFEICVKDNE